MSCTEWLPPPARPAHLQPPRPSFSAADRQALWPYWYPLCRAQDLADGLHGTTLLDLPLVAWRTAQGVRVARDLCPHRGVPLSLGTRDGDQLVCAYHGLHFGPDGACSRIPAHPGLAPAGSMRLSQFPARERYGLVWTCLGDPAAHDIPPLPDWDAPGFQQIVPAPVDIATSAGRQIEGFIDVAHFAWIHDSSFADRARPEVPDYQVEPTEDGLRFDYRSSVSNYPHARQHLQPAGFVWLRSFRVHAPFCATLAVHFPEGRRHTILNAASPVSATTTRLFSPLARNFTDTGSPDEAAAFKTLIVHEDRRIAEAQYPATLPLDPRDEAHFPSDRASAAYRRVLRRIGLGAQ